MLFQVYDACSFGSCQLQLLFNNKQCKIYYLKSCTNSWLLKLIVSAVSTLLYCKGHNTYRAVYSKCKLSYFYFSFFSVNHTVESSTPEHDITGRFVPYSYFVTSALPITTATVGDTILFEIKAPGNVLFILSLAVHFFK